MLISPRIHFNIPTRHMIRPALHIAGRQLLTSDEDTIP